MQNDHFFFSGVNVVVVSFTVSLVSLQLRALRPYDLYTTSPLAYEQAFPAALLFVRQVYGPVYAEQRGVLRKSDVADNTSPSPALCLGSIAAVYTPFEPHKLDVYVHCLRYLQPSLHSWL